jgi:hypothetical protein
VWAGHHIGLTWGLGGWHHTGWTPWPCKGRSPRARRLSHLG